MGVASSAFTILGAQNVIASKLITFPIKSVSVDGCAYFHNGTTQSSDFAIENGVGLVCVEFPSNVNKST